MALIELENVHVRYDDLVALDGVTCSIDGGTVGLLGPNGAGKSTLLKTLLGFTRATEGTVRLFGKELPRQALEVRQQLGYMPEREVVSPKISAVAFLTFCGRLFGMSRVDAMERTHEVLNYVGLGESRYRKMETYSTGMRQRLKLAQALVHDPRLLLLDEPTNGLDPEGRLEMLELIREVAKKRKVTIVLSSHLLPDVQHVCEHVMMIDGGRIVREGNISELTALQERIYEVRVRDNKGPYIAALERLDCTCRNRENGGLLVAGPAGADPAILFRAARDTNTQIRHYRPARLSLADAFMEAVGEGTAPDHVTRATAPAAGE